MDEEPLRGRCQIPIIYYQPTTACDSNFFLSPFSPDKDANFPSQFPYVLSKPACLLLHLKALIIDYMRAWRKGAAVNV